MKFSATLIASLFTAVQLASAAPAPVRREQLFGKADPTAKVALKSFAIQTGDDRCFAIDKDVTDIVSAAEFDAAPSSRLRTGEEIFKKQTPIKLVKCDDSEGQKFDVVTEGKNIDRDDEALIVSQVTNTCLASDRRHGFGTTSTPTPDFDEVFFAPCGGKDDGVLSSQAYQTVLDLTPDLNGHFPIVAPTVAGKAFALFAIIEDTDLNFVIEGDRINYAASAVDKLPKNEQFTFVRSK